MLEQMLLAPRIYCTLFICILSNTPSLRETVSVGLPWTGRVHDQRERRERPRGGVAAPAGGAPGQLPPALLLVSTPRVESWVSALLYVLQS